MPIYNTWKLETDVVYQDNHIDNVDDAMEQTETRATTRKWSSVDVWWKRDGGFKERKIAIDTAYNIYIGRVRLNKADWLAHNCVTEDTSIYIYIHGNDKSSHRKAQLSMAHGGRQYVPLTTGRPETSQKWKARLTTGIKNSRYIIYIVDIYITSPYIFIYL